MSSGLVVLNDSDLVNSLGDGKQDETSAAADERMLDVLVMNSTF